MSEMDITEIQIRSSQALHNLQRSRKQCQDAVSLLSLQPANEYSQVEISYERVKGQVNQLVVPLMMHMIDQMDTIATHYYEIMEVIKDEMGDSMLRKRQGRSTGDHDPQKQQHDKDQGEA